MLEFESLTQRVANDAVRIVARMDRDWMTIGRRPAGVCGAALILAARMNNFRRTVREVVFVVRVAEVTVNKRLDEFKVTESSKLTVEQFRKTDLESALDPPSFYEEKDSKGKRGRPRKASQAQQNADDHPRSRRGTPATANKQLQTPASTQQKALADRQSMPPPSRPVAIDPALLQASAQGLAELKSGMDHDNPPQPTPEPRPLTVDHRKLAKENEFDQERRKQITEDINDALPQVTEAANDLTGQPSSPVSSPEPLTPEPTQSSPDNAPSTEDSGTEAMQLAQDEDTASDQGDSEQETLPGDSKRNPRKPPPLHPDRLITAGSTSQSLLDRISSSLTIDDSEFASDPELADCLLTEAEHEVKKRIWTQENKDWLRAQQAKELKQQFAEQNGTERQVKRRKRRRTRMGDMSAYEGAEEGAEEGPFKDPADAVQKMMQRRGYSRKINYSMLDWTYAPSSRASEAATPSEVGTSMDTSREASVVEGMGQAEGDRKGESEVKAVEPKREGVGTKRKREEEAVAVEDEGPAAGTGANAEEPIELSDAEEESDGEDYFPQGEDIWRWGLYDSVAKDLGDDEVDEDD